MELVYTGGQPEGQRAGEEQILMPPLTGTTMETIEIWKQEAPLRLKSKPAWPSGGTANGVGHLLPLGPKRLTFLG